MFIKAFNKERGDILDSSQNLQTHIYLLTHGRAGEELIKSSEMIVGKLHNVTAVSLLPGVSPEEYAKEVEEHLKKSKGEALVFVDLFGGTPCNVALTLSEKYEICIVSGLNLNMLLESLTLVENLNGDKLATEVAKVGSISCMNVLAQIR